MPKDRKTRILLLLVLFALALRFAYFFTLLGHPEFRTPMLDSRWFHDQALAISGGHWSGPDAVFRGPLYPVFLAGIYGVTGPDPAAARAVQLLLGGVSVLLVARLGMVVFGASVGVLAGVLAAVSWILVYFEGEILIAAILPLLGTLLLLSLLRADRRGGSSSYLLAGLLFGLFAAARPNILVLLPAALFWIGWRRWRKSAVLLAGVLLLLVPLTVRNRVVSGEWVLLSSQGGINFYIGNHRAADGRHAVFPGLPSWRNEDVERLTAARIGHLPSPNELSRFWFGEALAEIAADPARFLAGLLRKSFFLLHAYEVGNNRDLALYRRANPVLSLPLVSYGLLLPLALVGLLSSPRRSREKNLLVAFFVTYGLSLVLFFVCARFRVPLLPVLFILAGKGLVEMGGRVRRRELRPLLFPLLLLATSSAIVNTDRWVAKEGVRGQDAFHRGNAHARRGEVDLAIASYREAVEKIPDFAGVHYHLGVVLRGEGREEEGVSELERAIALDPKNPRIPTALAAHLAERGDRERAEGLYRLAISLDPFFADAPIGLGSLLAQQGETEEAEALLRRGLSLAPGDPVALLNLGKLLSTSGRSEEGLELLLRLVREAPDSEGGWFELGNLFYRAGRPREAAEAFRRVAVLNEKDIRARMNLSLVSRRLGDREGARRALLEVLAIDPDHEPARMRLEELDASRRD